MLVVCNFAPVVHHGLRLGVPAAGSWRERLNTDSAYYGGSNVGTPLGAAHSEAVASHGRAQSIVLTLPPLATVFLNGPPERAAAAVATRSLEPAGPGRWARTATATASTSPCSRRTPQPSSCACSTPTATPRLHRAAAARRTAATSGTATCAGAGSPGWSTACAPTAPGGPTAATASTRTSCCSTPGRARSSATSTGAARTSAPTANTRSTWTCATTAASALKARVVHDSFDWQGDRPPATPLADTVLYEVHVRGFTKRHPGVPEALRGTYAGLASTRPSRT